MNQVKQGIKRMSGLETVESYLIRGELPHEQLDATTWVLSLDNERKSRIVLRLEDPIALLSASILDVGPDLENREGLYRTLLELNSQLVHCAYGLHGDRVVLSGAHPLESLDYNELQALVDDMTIALDTHKQSLSPWAIQSQAKA